MSVFCLIASLSERADALGLSGGEVAGILGIADADWRMFLRHWPDVGVEGRLDRSMRLLCELLGSVLAFGGRVDGAHWMREHHPAMGDSPLGRLIRSPSALAWLSAVLFDERGR